MIDRYITVFYDGEDITHKVMGVELSPEAERVFGSECRISMPKSDLILTLINGDVIHTDTISCEVILTNN